MEIACIDSTVLIEHYRSKDKTKSFLYKLGGRYEIVVPAVVKYEILRGDKKKDGLWVKFFSDQITIPFDDACAGIAASVYAVLKSQNNLIGPEDILIAATALTHSLPLATINKKHFERVDDLTLITPEMLVN